MGGGGGMVGKGVKGLTFWDNIYGNSAGGITVVLTLGRFKCFCKLSD